MLIKILGACLVGGCFFSICRAYLEKEKKKGREAEGFLRLLRFLRAEIASFGTPTGEIFARFSDEALSSCGFLDHLRQEGFSAALSSCRPLLSVTEEIYTLLSSFGEELGKRYLSEELARLDYYIGALGELLESTKREAPKQARLCRALLFCAAGMVIIFLL